MSGSWLHFHGFIISLPYPLPPPSSSLPLCFSVAHYLPLPEQNVRMVWRWCEYSRRSARCSVLYRGQCAVKFTDMHNSCPSVEWHRTEATSLWLPHLFRQAGRIIRVPHRKAVSRYSLTVAGLWSEVVTCVINTLGGCSPKLYAWIIVWAFDSFIIYCGK